MKKKLTFEQSLERLEEIAALLDRGNAPLEEALKLYEEGKRLSADCEKQLAAARARLTELSEISAPASENDAQEEEQNG